jgi:hypothetical protein
METPAYKHYNPCASFFLIKCLSNRYQPNAISAVDKVRGTVDFTQTSSRELTVTTPELGFEVEFDDEEVESLLTL